MNIQEIQDKAVIGISIQLETVELRLLKDKWVTILGDLNAGDDIKDSMLELNHFMSKLFDKVPSTQEIHDSLFSNPSLIVEELSNVKIHTRVNKCYRELGISIEEYVELASELGYKIEPRPASKISVSLHDMITDLHRDKQTVANLDAEEAGQSYEAR
jgi:hypothetical protein